MNITFDTSITGFNPQSLIFVALILAIAFYQKGIIFRSEKPVWPGLVGLIISLIVVEGLLFLTNALSFTLARMVEVTVYFGAIVVFDWLFSFARSKGNHNDIPV